MKPEKKITLVLGYLNYIDLETGFWQLNENEEKYRMIDLPDNIKKENLRVAALVEIIDNEMSVFMSGKTAKIIDYKIVV
jgi:hypothetical protein